MSDGSNDDVCDSLFHGCAWAAFVDLLAEEGSPPDREATRRLCYAYYEEELRKKNAATSDAAGDADRAENEKPGLVPTARSGRW